jgi:riboflavin synthase
VFTGMVVAVGRVVALEGVGGDRRLEIDARDARLPPLEAGDSIAVNGVCLTATSCDRGGFAADVSLQTLSVTNLGSLRTGSRVNLEPSLRLGGTLGGHLVMGHVDGVGRVVTVTEQARSCVLGIELPEGLARYVARKGSVTVDGVSLTVNSVDGDRFEVNVVPHTRAATIIGEYRPGTAVNIEVDLLARYLERLALPGAAGQ